ncbi:carbohydrate porin [Fluviibacterium sp. S390]|uniref:carbohydrate porin n=1 Tax=Fluviibacterium sp. S390 TaxID=3415139 RepID=UPI003C7D7695
MKGIDCPADLRLLACLTCVAFPFAATSQEQTDAPDFDYGEFGVVFENPVARDGYLSFGAVGRAGLQYFEFKERVQDEAGFYWVIEDRLINQWADGSRINDNELNVIARLDFAGDAPGHTSLNIWGQFANSLGGNTAGQFQSDLGILSPLNGGNGGPDNSVEILQMLALEHITADERFRFQIGKLAMRTLVNLNRYAHGDSEMFFSPMLGNNPVVPYTALLGNGIFAQWKAETWYLSGVVRAPDVETGLSLEALQDGNREYVIEAALQPAIPGLGYGEYRLTWSLDTATDTQSEVRSLSASFDQDIGDRLGAFFRYSVAEDTFRAFRERTAIGFQVKTPFGFRYDRIGVGVWQGDPTDENLGMERGFEAYYRAQVSRAFEITPDIQYIANPALSGADSEVVFGLRFRLVL